MEKAKVEEYAELKRELSDHGHLVVSISFIIIGPLFFIAMILGTQTYFEWWLFILSGLGVMALIFTLKERKKLKARFKQLQEELDKED